MTFSERIKDLRNEYNLTQKELADKIKSSASKIGMWEAGKRDPGTEDLIILGDIFNVSTDYLLGKSNMRESYKESDEENSRIDLWLSKTDGYKELPEADREKIIEYARMMLDKHKIKKDK